jgi:hypothetical protein
MRQRWEEKCCTQEVEYSGTVVSTGNSTEKLLKIIMQNMNTNFQEQDESINTNLKII